MEILIVSIVAFLTAGLTLFSGFGLGTLLLPAFLLFFPAQLSVAMTAIVHFLNNLFKLVLLGKHADWKVVLRFGIPAILAAFGGAALLFFLSDIEPLVTYMIGGRECTVTPVKLIMGILIAAFALFEVLPAFQRLQFEQRYLPVGGLLSGFFGGLSGHQGALRSAFLIRAGLTKEAFIATGVVIACLIDFTRLGVYAQQIAAGGFRENAALLTSATLSAFAGAYLGTKLVKKVTMKIIQLIVSTLLFMIAFLLIAGLI